MSYSFHKICTLCFPLILAATTHKSFAQTQTSQLDCPLYPPLSSQFDGGTQYPYRQHAALLLVVTDMAVGADVRASTLAARASGASMPSRIGAVHLQLEAGRHGDGGPPPGLRGHVGAVLRGAVVPPATTRHPWIHRNHA